tara:strand:+ start:592 stop:1275 length:684 start_codon:yes stop_codon:yes gene_type:complete
MFWDDQGFLLSKNRYGENSAITEFYTKSHGKVSGIIYGATSKKIKNYLLIGNKFHISFKSKNENQLGYFKIEIDEITTPLFMENQKKLSCIVTTMNLIKLLTVENQSNIEIFNLINTFFKNLNNDNWISELIFWELNFFKLIGYDLELNNIVHKEFKNGEYQYFVSNSNQKKYIPTFIVENNKNEKNVSQIFYGLKIVTDFLDKSILRPNNISYPKSRVEFLNLIKN